MGHVTIACKLPHGVHMDVEGKRITINGTNAEMGKVIGGFGITEGVDAAHAETWLKMHAESPMVKDKLIFVNGKANEVKAEARARREQKNGFEGVNANKPAPGLEPTDEQKQENAKAANKAAEAADAAK